MLLKLPFLSGFLFWSITAWPQFEQNFKPSPYLDTIPSEVYRKMRKQLSDDKAKLGSGSGKTLSFKKSVYDNRFEYLLQQFNGDRFILESPLSEVLERVRSKIEEANPGLTEGVSLFIVREKNANAVSYGEGTIAVTLGLLSRMETEDQLAFILCHEIAHLSSRHSELRINELASLNSDTELKKKINEVRNSPYNKYSRVKELIKEIGTSISSYSRANEKEADSVGLIYYLKTRYSPRQAIRCMEILDSADASKYRWNPDFKQLFSFREYPFKDQWLMYKKSDTWHAPADEESEIMKTHPDCQQRIIALARQMDSYKVDYLSLSGATPIGLVKTGADFELIESEYHFKHYGYSLFIALHLSRRYPENTYAQALIARCLYQLLNAQKRHELGKALDLPDPRFEENYDRFLTFIHNLRVAELGNLAYHYAITRPEILYKDEEMLFSVWLCSQLPSSKLDPNSLARDYLAAFPGGKYSKIIRK